MTSSYSYIEKCFKELGLTIVHEVHSDSTFENFVIEACARNFCVRAERDRQSESLDLRAQSGAQEWYELGIVMTYMFGESKLFDHIALTDQVSFLRTHLHELDQLFAQDKYASVEPRLKELERYKAKIRFPEWYK